MKSGIIIMVTVALLLFNGNAAKSQDNANKLKLSGELTTDQRILLQSPNDWAWNENRLTLKFDNRIAGNSKFYSEVWLRNIGVPNVSSAADLYNKGLVNPYDIEIREAYVQLFGFLSDKLDVKIGRQRIAWGTADKLNPTDNLNPYDFEDVLDFGRHRGSDAATFDYYFNSEFSLQGVFIPFFQPANMPVGVFAKALTSSFEVPPGLTLRNFNDTVIMPRYNFSESSVFGIKFRGFAAGFDFSLSYVWGHDGLPVNTYNKIIPVDFKGGIDINSQLTFYRNHIFGADMAGSIGGVGVWAEAAAFLPDNDIVTTTDFSALPLPPGTPAVDEKITLKKEPYVKFILGADYNFANGAYLNFQYMHGFINERGRDNLNDYFFVQLERRFFDDKLKITPLAGGFIVNNWSDMGNNYSLIYVPAFSYMATDNAEITVSAAIFDGKGDNMFTKFKNYNMLMFKLKYSF